MKRHGETLQKHVAKWKKTIWKSYISYNSNYSILEKAKTIKVIKISSCYGISGQAGWISGGQGIFRAVKILW